MKLIHCADIHLDSKLNTHLSGELAKERKIELLNTFQNMVRYASENNVEGILLAGDLFDTKNVTQTTKKAVLNLFLTYPEICFFYLKGNHDEGSFLYELEEIPINLYLFQDKWSSYEFPGHERVVISAVELTKENQSLIGNSLLLNHEKINIVMLHGQETEYQAKDKTEIIPLSTLRNRGIDYLALGHIHSYKKERLDGRGCYCYSGCLEGRGFDECEECGFVVLEIDEAAHQIESIFVPFANRKNYILPVDISLCMNSIEILEQIQHTIAKKNLSSRSLVRICLKGKVDVECEKNPDYLRMQLLDRFYYLEIRDESVYGIDERAYEYDQSLKGEFVRTVLAREDLSETDKASVIHYGLLALSGEELLSR